MVCEERRRNDHLWTICASSQRTLRDGTRPKALLGLAIAKLLVEGQDGRIEAHNFPQGGLQVGVFLKASVGIVSPA
jgi:K+-sensing histidine kinase KdpD